jgi:hypothetical protein
MAVNLGIEKIAILKEFSDFISPLSEEAFSLLEKSVVSEGCRDPLTVWQKKESLILIDGHNRYKICAKNNIPFKIRKISFSDTEEVKEWMINNQLGRRNLTPDQLSYYRGLKYLTLKRSKGGYHKVLLKGQNELSTSEILAAQFKVSKSTVKRDAKFAEGVNIIAKSNPLLKKKILSGEVKVKKADIQVLTEAQNPDRITIKNEADLFNKAKRIRANILEEVEKDIKRIQKSKIEKAQEEAHKYWNQTEPIFIEKGDGVKRIKGMIISAINKAINDRDVSAIKELKKLIDRLAGELFD